MEMSLETRRFILNTRILCGYLLDFFQYKRFKGCLPFKHIDRKMMKSKRNTSEN